MVFHISIAKGFFYWLKDFNDMKRCPYCQENKELSEFSRNKSTKDSHSNECKACCAKRDRRYRATHKEHIRERDRAYKILNHDRIAWVWREWRLAHPEKMKAYQKVYREKYPDRITISQKKWCASHPSAMAELGRQAARRKRNTVMGKLNSNLSRTIRHSLINDSKNRQRWESLVGYTAEQLKKHLEKKFRPGMSWDNYGKHGWHIDHIIPISAFNFETPADIDFKKCWALKNLQPLDAKANWAKHANLDKPFQPSLAI